MFHCPSDLTWYDTELVNEAVKFSVRTVSQLSHTRCMHVWFWQEMNHGNGFNVLDEKQERSRFKFIKAFICLIKDVGSG